MRYFVKLKMVSCFSLSRLFQSLFRRVTVYWSLVADIWWPGKFTNTVVMLTQAGSSRRMC